MGELAERVVVSNNHARVLDQRVRVWAREHAVSDLYYGTPYAFCSSARRAHIITDEEYETLKEWYADSWHFRGD